MKKTFSLFAIIILTYGCQKTSNRSLAPEHYIPNNAQMVLRINSMDVFKSALKNNPILSKTKLQSMLEDHLGPIDSLNISGPLLICKNKENEQFNYTFITEKKHIANKSLLNLNQTLDSIWILSSNPSSKVKEEYSNHPFSTLSATTDKNATFNIYFGPSKKKQNKFSLFEQVLLDVNATPEQLSISGIYTDKINDWARLFHQISPEAQQLAKVIPNDVENFKSFVYTDFEQFSKNIQAIDSTAIASEFSKSLFGTIQEIGSMETAKGIAIALHSIDISASRELLLGFQEKAKIFRSVPIFKFNNDSIFQKSFGKLLPKLASTRYTILDHYLVFSDQEKILEDVISDYTNKNSLNSSKAFQNTIETLSDEASFQKNLDTKDLATTLNELLDTNFSEKDLNAYKNSVVQIIKDDEVVHLNAEIVNFRPATKQNSVSEVFSLTLEAPILGTAQFVKNHQTKQKDIVVQDIENHLYLISNKGVVRWKKKLPGPILGQIKQVDIFKSGRLQMVFSTTKKVYVLDRLGRNVEGFPLNFKDRITQAVAVFDYDKNKNYRLLVTQDKSLLMYDGKGKRVKGFSHQSKKPVNSQPQHIRYNSKDYIVFTAGDKLSILNRRGKKRINVKETIKFSGQKIYFYNNKFTTLDSDGALVQVDTKGRVSKQSLGFDPLTEITTSSRTLAAQWANYLQIKSTKITLDYGSYLPPQLFYVNDKIYIALTDQQLQKVSLYDSNGVIFSGFPVYGFSQIDLSNADRNSSLEFICQSGASELIMYQLH